MNKLKKYVDSHKNELIAEAALMTFYLFGAAVGYKVCSIRHRNARGLAEMINLIPKDEVWVCMRKDNRFSVATVAEKLFTGKPM